MTPLPSGDELAEAKAQIAVLNSQLAEQNTKIASLERKAAELEDSQKVIKAYIEAIIQTTDEKPHLMSVVFSTSVKKKVEDKRSKGLIPFTF